MTDLLPFDEQAEQAVLGCALIEPEAARIVCSNLRVSDFVPEAHQRIFAAMQALAQLAIPVDLVFLGGKLRDEGQLESCGGAEYLTALINTVPTAAHVWGYAERVIAKAQQRRLIVTANGIMQDAHNGGVTTAQAITRLLEADTDRSWTGANPLAERLGIYVDSSNAKADEKAGIYGPRWGLPTIDLAHGGMAEETLVIVKAETGYGKTSLLRQSALETLRGTERGAVALYLLEDTVDRWLDGAVAWLARIELDRLARGGKQRRSATEHSRIQETYTVLDHWGERLLLTDQVRTMAQITADVQRHLQRKRSLLGIYVDYAQIIQAEGESTFDRISSVANGLLALHTQTGVPIITASQVTHQEGGTKRSRYSPEMEHNASLVLLLERGGKDDNEDAARQSTQGLLLVTKQRRGSRCGGVRLRCDLAQARIGEETDRYGQ